MGQVESRSSAAPSAYDGVSSNYAATIDSEAILRAFDSEGWAKGASAEMTTALHYATSESVEKASLIRRELVRSELEKALKRNAPSKRGVTEVLIETPHPYADNMEVDYQAIIPGATELTLEFDPLCATETNCDWIQLNMRPNGEGPVRDRLTGPVGSWPKDPMKIPGDRVFAHFHSDGSRTDWGVKIKVTGIIPKKVPSAADSAGAETESLAVSAMVRTIIALLRSQSRSDPELQTVVLDIFQNLLTSVKPGSLAKVSSLISASLSEFQGYLVSLLPLQDSPAKWGALVQMMLSLAIARGSQLDVIRLLPQLLSASATSLPVLALLRTWAASTKTVSAELASHAPEDGAAVTVATDWGLIEQHEMRFISSDGSFLYAVTERHRLKIGTGLNLTDAGFIYDAVAHDETFPVVLIHIEGVAPLLGFAPDANSNGRSTFAWFDRNSVTMTRRVSTDGIEWPNGPFCSNSVHFYVIEHTEEESGVKVVLAVYTPTLDDDTWTDSPRRIEWPSAHWSWIQTSAMPYTNGREMNFISSSTVRRVDIETGAVLGSIDRDPATASTGFTDASTHCHTYDLVNNLTWTVSSKMGEVLAYPNPGYWRPSPGNLSNDIMAVAAQSALNVLSQLPAEETHVPKDALGSLLFTIMDSYVGTRARPRFPTHAESATFVYQEPFVWELVPSTFGILFDLLSRYTASAVATPSLEVLHQLVCCVHMLHANLLQLATFEASARMYGMTDELAAAYMAKFYELIDLSIPGLAALPADKQASVQAALVALRDATCYTVAAGYQVLVPSPKARVSLFASMISSKAGLSPARVQLLNSLLQYALFSLVDTFAAADQIKETAALLTSILQEAAAAAVLAAGKLPRSVAGVTVKALNDLESVDAPSALIMFLRESQAVIRASEDDAFIPLKKSYARALLDVAAKVTTAFAAVPEGLSTASQEIKDAYRDLAVSSYKRAFGTLIPGTLVDLHAAIGDRSIAEEFQSVLLATTAAMEALSAALPFAASGPDKMETFETAHPYENNTDFTREFDLGMTALVVRFDPQCKTERTHDWINITDSAGKEYRFSGPDPWPAAVEVTGPRLIVAFHSDGSNVEWGVLGTIQTSTPQPWLIGVKNIVSSLAVRASSQLLSPPATTPEYMRDPARIWLADPIFENGRLAVNDLPADVKAFIADARAGGPESSALIDYFIALTKADNAVFIDASAMAKDVRRCIGYSFAVQLHHSRSVQDALALVGHKKAPGSPVGGLTVVSGGPPPTLITAWKQAVETGTWLRRQIDEVFKTVAFPDGANINQLIAGVVDRDGPRIPDSVIPAAQAAAADAAVIIAAFEARVTLLADFSPAIEPAARQYLLSAAKAMLPSMEVVTPLATGGPSKARQRWGAAIKAARTMSNWAFWKTAMARGLRKRSEEQGALSRADPYKPVYDACSRFIQSADIDPPKFAQMIAGNEKTALLRTAAFRGVLEMLRSGTISGFTLAELLFNVSASLAGFSYREFTYGVDGLVAIELRQVYFELLGALGKTLSEGAEHDAAVLILQLWNIRIRHTDKAFVVESRIFPSIIKALSQLHSNSDDEKALHKLALGTLASLGAQVLQQSPGEPRDDCLLRGKHILSVIMARLGQVAGLSSIPVAVSPFVCDLLSLTMTLLNAGGGSDMAGAMASDENIRMLLRVLMAVDSVDAQLITIELLGRILEVYVPSGPTDPALVVGGEPFVDFALRLVGACLIPPCPSVFVAPAIPTVVSASLQHIEGDRGCAKRVAYTLIMLLRQLSASAAPHWQATTKRALNAGLASVSGLLSDFILASANAMKPAVTPALYSSLLTCMGTIAVLGGTIAPTLYAGGRGRLLGSSTDGSVLQLTGDRVLFATGSGGGRSAQWINASAVEAVETVEPSFADIDLGYEAIHRFLTLTDARFANPELQSLYSDMQLRLLRVAETVLASRPALAAAFVEAKLVPELMRQVLAVGTITSDERRLLVQMIPLVEARSLLTSVKPACLAIGNGGLSVRGGRPIEHAYIYPPGFTELPNVPMAKDAQPLESVSRDSMRRFGAYMHTGIGASPVRVPGGLLGIDVDVDDKTVGFTVTAIVKRAALAEGAVVLAWEGSVPFVVGVARNGDGALVPAVQTSALSAGLSLTPLPVESNSSSDNAYSLWVLTVGLEPAGSIVTFFQDGQENCMLELPGVAINDDPQASVGATVLVGPVGEWGVFGLGGIAVYDDILSHDTISDELLPSAVSVFEALGNPSPAMAALTWSPVPVEMTVAAIEATNIKPGTQREMDALAGAALLTPFNQHSLTEVPVPDEARAIATALVRRYQALATAHRIAAVIVIGGNEHSDAETLVAAFAGAMAGKPLSVPLTVVAANDFGPLVERIGEVERIESLLEIGPFRVDNAIMALKNSSDDVYAAVDLLMSASSRAAGEGSLLTALAKDGAADVDQARGRPTNWSGEPDAAEVPRSSPGNGVDNSTTTIVQTAATPSAWWEVVFDSRIKISSIVVRNIAEGVLSRFRDLEVSVWSQATLVYKSPLLNPENMLLNPDTLIVTPESTAGLIGDRVRITRLPDEDLSGLASTAAAPDAPKNPSDSDRFALSFSSCEVYGVPEAGGKVKAAVVLNGALSVESYNGGEWRDGYGVSNAFAPGSSQPHCSKPGLGFDAVLKYASDDGFTLSAVTVGPALHCTSSLATLAVWVSEFAPDVESYSAAFDGWTGGAVPEGKPAPALYVDVASGRSKNVTEGAGVVIAGRYLHVKFISASGDGTSIDSGYVCFRGFNRSGVPSTPSAAKATPLLNASLSINSFGPEAPENALSVLGAGSGGRITVERSGPQCDLILESTTAEPFTLGSVELAAVPGSSTDVRKLAVWVWDEAPFAETYSPAFDGWSGGALPDSTPRPALYMDVDAGGRVQAVSAADGAQVAGRFIHVKFISAAGEGATMDIGALSFRAAAGSAVPPTPGGAGGDSEGPAFGGGASSAAAAAPVEEWRPSRLSDVSGDTQTYCEAQSDEELLASISSTSSPLMVKLEGALTRLQTSVVPERLGEIAALAARKIASYSRQAVISQLLVHWPETVPLSVHSLGSVANLATFLLSFTKNQKPLEYLLVKRKSKLQLDAVMTTINAVVARSSPEDANNFLKTLLAACIADHGEDDTMRYAALVVLQEVLLPQAALLAEDFSRIHDAVLRWIWKSTNARHRESLFSLLKQILISLISSGRAPAKKSHAAYEMLKTHLFAKRQTEVAIESMYVQSLLEVALLFERVKRAAVKAEGDGAGSADDDAAAAAAAAAADAGPEIPPLPSALIPKSQHATVNGWTARAVSSGERCVVVSDKPIGRLAGLTANVGYYEATIRQFPGGSPFCGTGFVSEDCPSSELSEKTLGIANKTVAMHSDDGALYSNNGRKAMGAPYEQGDVVGFGLDFAAQRVFFTKNGSLLSSYVDDFDLNTPAYAAVTMRAIDMEWTFNFGDDRNARPFAYNIASYVPGSASSGSGSGSSAATEGPPAWWQRALQLDALSEALAAGSIAALPEAVLEAAYNPVAKTEEIFESSHPYENSQDNFFEFICPGVEYLMVRCDARCRSEANYDYFAIYGDKERTNEIRRFTGRDESANWPSETRIDSDRIFMTFHSDGSNNDWGFKISVSAPSKELDSNTPKINVNDMRALYAQGWSIDNDFGLMALVTTVQRKKGIADVYRAPAAAVREAMVAIYADGGAGYVQAPVDQLVARLPLIALFNQLARDLLPFIDLMKAVPSASGAGRILTFSSRMRLLSPLISGEMKYKFLGAMLSKTACSDSYPEIRASRIKAARQILNFTNQADTLYAQISQALKSTEAVRLIRQNERAWKINFVGEQAIDAGGPYRESITVIAQELEAECGLFQLCPNGRLGQGLNQGTSVPMPRYTSAEHLEYYRFAGRMFGVSIRTKFSLPLSLAPFTWKALLGAELTKADLASIDKATVAALEMVESAEGLDADTFGEVFMETFTTVLADGSVVELCPGGHTRELTYANRSEYVRLAIEKHIHAYDTQIEALREGLASIVPLAVIQGLFNEGEFEKLVCGDPIMNVDALIGHTVYADGVSASDQHVQWFWEVLREMEPDQQAAFLKFSWGRCRLPNEPASYTFKIAQFGGSNGESALPVSHTCFGTLDLPVYRSKETLRAKLVLAITLCGTIDGDGNTADFSDYTN